MERRHIPDWIGCKKKVPCDPCSGGTQNGCVPYEKNIWVTITWVTNGGTWVHCSNDTDCKKYIDSECGCIEDDYQRDDACMYGSDGNYTRVFKKDDVYNPYDVGCLEREECGNLIGWSTSYDSNKPLESENITIEGKPEDSMIYYAIWACDFATVTWLDCDGTTVLYTEDGVKKGIMLTEEDLPESLDPDNIIKGWKVDGTDVTFPYEIKKDTVFTAVCAKRYDLKLRFTNYIDIKTDHIDFADITVQINDVNRTFTKVALGITAPQYTGRNTTTVELNGLKNLSEGDIVSITDITNVISSPLNIDVMDSGDCPTGQDCAKKRYGHDGNYEPRYNVIPIMVVIGQDAPLIDVILSDDSYIDCSQLHTVRFISATVAEPSSDCATYVYSKENFVCHNSFVTEYRNPVYMRYDGVGENNTCLFEPDESMIFERWEPNPALTPITSDIDFRAQWAISPLRSET